MRPITKRAEPAELTAWRASGNADWQPSYADLRQPRKGAVRDALLAEQGHVCCYCERRVGANDDSHIEHLVPQSVRPDLGLDYGNLLCSCSARQHCGHERGDRELPVHPLQEDCSQVFEFGSDGSIGPRANMRPAAAERAIRVLGLNAATLRDRRRRAIDAFLATVALEPLASWGTSVAKLLEPDPAGHYVPHATAVANVIQRSLRTP